MSDPLSQSNRDISQNGPAKKSSVHDEVHQPSPLLPAPPLASSRYSRQLLIPQISLSGQRRLTSSRVLIIGLGGLGSPAALYLAGAGIGTLGFLDHDVVEESNLHRQIVHRQSSLSSDHSDQRPMTKVDSAIRSCRELNPLVSYRAFNTSLSRKNALDVIGQFDLVLDCTDNPATRYLISDACVVLGRTLVSGAAQRLEGQLMVLNYSEQNTKERGPCYRCVFPRPPSPEMVRGCSEVGILGPVVGVVGTLMATEAIKLIVQGLTTSLFHGQEAGSNAISAPAGTPASTTTAPPPPKKPSMLLYNAWSNDPRTTFRSIGLRGTRPDCLSCGDAEFLATKNLSKITRETFQHGRLDYEAFCGRVEDINILPPEERIGAVEFLQRVGKDKGRQMVVDVREENEFDLGAKVRDSVNIPISRILRDKKEAFKSLVGAYGQGQNGGMPEVDVEMNQKSSGQRPLRAVYFVCQRGNDSQMAVQALKDLLSAGEKGDGAGKEGNVVEGTTISQGTHQSRHSTRSWIGDVQGGFIALEKAVAGSNG